MCVKEGCVGIRSAFQHALSGPSDLLTQQLLQGILAAGSGIQALVRRPFVPANDGLHPPKAEFPQWQRPYLEVLGRRGDGPR